MKKITLLLVLVLIFSCKEKPKEEPKVEKETTQSSMEKKSEWKVLFDGTSWDGWHVYSGREIEEAWSLEDGAMLLNKTSEARKDGERFNVVTDEAYTNFVLSIEWMVNSGANSGIMWGVVEDEKYPEPYVTGPEIQVLDNIGHPDSKTDTSHQAGALYDMVSPSQEALKAVGKWNHYLITVNHDTNEGSVVLNGIKIVEFPVHGEAWDAMVAKSKFATWEAFGKSKTGRIALQDHGEPIVIGYRNIKIKEL
ncbi:MAG: DUF1080 domain-containing protein [Bacteroidota bacterium]